MPLPRAVLPDLPPRAPAKPCRTRDEPELGVYRTCPRQSLRSRPARASDNVPVVVAILSGCARRCEAVIARGVTSHWSDANSTAKGRQSAAIKRPGRDQAKSLPRQDVPDVYGHECSSPVFPRAPRRQPVTLRPPGTAAPEIARPVHARALPSRIAVPA